ncbi:MAG: hypothetical protein KC560_08755 [Myxococcales bacterium]|nr:hypothetical protein [Myxococcales bacterium]
MRIRTLVSTLALVALAHPASAVVKTYDATAPHGTVGDEILFTTTLCPPVQSTPGRLQGQYRLEDAAGGTVTLTEFGMRRFVNTNIANGAIDGVFGPGSYVFVTSDSTSKPTEGTTHAGSTAPGGSIDWGVLSGWTRSGVAFCISSPLTICNVSTQVPHGITTSAPNANSPTYDLGTWAFDAEGDFAATTAYITQTANGGLTNIQFLLRGAFVGGSVPALPIVGAGALAVALLAMGARTALRKR